MPSLKELLSPARQNPIQRQGLFVSLALASLVLLLHFPFDGYNIEQYVITHHGYGPCPNPTMDDLKKMTVEQIRLSVQDLQRCGNAGEMQISAFSEWESKAPIIEWFGSVIHAIAALAFVFSLGGMWLWVFRTHDDG